MREGDSLICLHCGGKTLFLSVTEEAPVIEQILRHVVVGIQPPPAMSSTQGG